MHKQPPTLADKIRIVSGKVRFNVLKGVKISDFGNALRLLYQKFHKTYSIIEKNSKNFKKNIVIVKLCGIMDRYLIEFNNKGRENP